MPMRGTTQTLTATFYESSGGPAADPFDGPTLSIYLGETLILAVPETEIERDGVGLYRYEWTIPVDATIGTYTAAWSAQMDEFSQPSIGYDSFDVTAYQPPASFDGCEWPVDPACLGDQWNSYSSEVQGRAVALASATLHRLTGRRVGGCPVTVRPQAARGACFVPFVGMDPHLTPFGPGVDTQGRWVNGCGTGYEAGIALPPPVVSVIEVRVDGAVIPPSDYALLENRLMWMGAGESPFPLSQDMAKPLTEPGTFAVTYMNSYPVDSNGAYAAGVLALEFARACAGSNKCRLPATVTSVVRGGVSMEVTPGAFPDGFTGIREVDTYIALWNPRGMAQPSTVWTPNRKHRVVR